MNDPLDSAIPVGSGPGTTVPPAGSPPPPASSTPPPPAATPPASAPVASVSGSEKIWAILSHLSFLIGFWFIIPLVVYFALRDESAYASGNAREALNFHLSLFIYGLGCGLLAFTIIAIPLVAVIAAAMVVGGVVLAIVAAIKASDGEVYHYPLTIRLIT